MLIRRAVLPTLLVLLLLGTLVGTSPGAGPGTDVDVAVHDGPRRHGTALDGVPEPGGDADEPVVRSGLVAGGYAAALREAVDVPVAPLSRPHDWVERGPFATGGRITDLALHDDVLYVATASGGLWRSDDDGRTLQPAWPRDLPQPIGAVTVTAGGVLLAGTGEANAGGGSTTFPGTGLYRSTDGGLTWAPSGLPDSATVARLVAHPTDPDVVWAAAGGDLFGPGGERGIYVSEDAGVSWTRVLEGATPTAGGADLAIDPADPDHLLASMWDRQRMPDLRRYGGSGSGLYESTDGGRSWAPISDGIPGFTDDAGRIAVAFSPADPRVAYAVVTRGDGRSAGFHRSEDGGSTWTMVTNGPRYAGSQFIFGWWFSKVFPAPEDPDRVLVPGLTLLESTDGGATFAADGRVHADHHALLWDPEDPSRAWLGSDGGLYRSTDGGRVFTWTLAEQQPFTQPYTVAVPPTDQTRVAAGFQDIGCMLADGDEPWTSVGGCGDGVTVSPHPTDADDVIVCGQYGRCRRTTTFGGGAANLPTPPVDRAAWSAPLVRLAADPEHLLFGGNTLHRSEDGGGTWTTVSPDLTRGSSPDIDYPYGTITEILPLDGDGTGIVVGTDDGLVQRTDDGGATWRTLLDGDRWVTGLAAGGRVLLVGTSGYFDGEDSPHVRASTDGGDTWVDVAAGLPDAPVNDVVVAGDAVVVATDVGVHVTWDLLGPDGPTGHPVRWYRVGADLPQAPALDLDHRDDTGLLTVATFGRGVWQTRLPRITRWAGEGRYATAVEVGRAGAVADPVDTVVLASGEDFPDALTAAALVARAEGWRLLLTARDTLPEATAEALTDLAPATVIVVGGPAAVADRVLDEVSSLVDSGTVLRLAGDSRYATAVDVAMAHRDVQEVLLATSGGPFDALAAAALAVQRDAVVLLTDPDALPAVTADALATLTPERVTVIGGSAVVSDEVLGGATAAAGGATGERLAGPDRFATAGVVARASAPDGADAVWLASGTAWVDALAAAASADPVLLVDSDGVPGVTADVLATLGPVDVRLAGGTAVVGDAVESAVLHGAG